MKRSTIVFFILTVLWTGQLLCAAIGLEGGWKGTFDTGLVRFRVAMVLQKDVRGEWQGTFNNIDEGMYDIPMTNLMVTNAALHARLPTGEAFDFKMDPSGSKLEGNCLQSNGHFQEPGRNAPMTFTRGMDFLVPRMDPEGKTQTFYNYHLPLELHDGWKRGDLRSAPVDPELIFKGLSKIADGTFPHIHSVLVAQRNKLLVDEYFYGYGPKDPHPLQSVTKSVFSMLVGIASAKGLLEPEEKLYDHFPEYRSKAGWQDTKNQITLEDLLTMTSGYACDDWKNSTSCSWAMVDSPSWLDFALSQPLDHEPGEHFAYCGSCLTPLSVLLERQSGMNVPKFAQKYLFDPLGIQTPFWMEDTGGITPPAFGLSMRPRDLAKLGLLYLHDGKWGRDQVVSKEWIDRSLSALVPSASTHGKGDYGYLWWARDLKVGSRTFRIHFAWGVGGQHLFLVPALDLVCVVTGGNENDARLGRNSFRLLEDYVLPAFAPVLREAPSSRE